MKRIALLITFAGVLLISCNKEDSIVQTHQFEERTSGNLALTSVDAIVVQNEIGPVVIEGNSNPSGIGWFLNKLVTAESQNAANQVFSQILIDLEIANDTAYVRMIFPTGTVSCNSLLSLTVPNYMPIVLRRVSGTTDVLYLQSKFVGENVTTTTIRGHHGDCDLTGTSGDVSVEMSLREGGLCRVMFGSGNIILRVPSSTSAMLSAQTGSGMISCSALVVADSVQTAHTLAGRLGMGSGTIQLTTGTGNIVITGF